VSLAKDNYKSQRVGKRPHELFTRCGQVARQRAGEQQAGGLQPPQPRDSRANAPDSARCRTAGAARARHGALQRHWGPRVPDL